MDIDWGTVIITLVTTAAGGAALLWRVGNYFLERAAKADNAAQIQINDLREQVDALETAQEDMVIKHAADRQQWEAERENLVRRIEAQHTEIERQREAINVLETAYKDSEKHAAKLEQRVALLEAELDEKTRALDAMRDRLHNAEIELAKATTEAETYRVQHTDMFELLKRYQQVQLSGRAQNDKAA